MSRGKHDMMRLLNFVVSCEGVSNLHVLRKFELPLFCQEMEKRHDDNQSYLWDLAKYFEL